MRSSTLILSLLLLFSFIAGCSSKPKQKTYAEMYNQAENARVIDIEDDSDIANEAPTYVKMDEENKSSEIRLYLEGEETEKRERTGGVVDPDTGMKVNNASVETVDEEKLDASPPYEISKIDITRVNNPDSSNVTILGFKVGDSRTKVEKLLPKKGFYYDDRTRTLTGEGLLIKFDKKNKAFSIGLNSNFREKVSGRTTGILDPKILSDENYRHKLLGYESGIEKGKVSLPGGHSFETLTIKYAEQGFEISGVHDSGKFEFNYFTLTTKK